MKGPTTVYQIQGSGASILGNWPVLLRTRLALFALLLPAAAPPALFHL